MKGNQVLIVIFVKMVINRVALYEKIKGLLSASARVSCLYLLMV